MGTSLLRKAWTISLLSIVQWVWLTHYINGFYWSRLGFLSVPFVKASVLAILSVVAAIIIMSTIVSALWWGRIGTWVMLSMTHVTSVYSYSKYLLTATNFTWFNSSYLKQILMPGDKIEGILAPTLASNSKAKGLYVLDARYPKIVLSDMIVRKLGLTHLLLYQSQFKDYESAMPIVMDHARLLKTMIFQPVPDMPEQRILLFAIGDGSFSGDAAPVAEESKNKRKSSGSKPSGHLGG